MDINEQTILDTIAVLKRKPSAVEQLRKWLPSILVVIALLGFVFAPFREAEKERNKMKRDITTIKQILWQEIPEPDRYLDNPFTTRSINISLYGSEIYCNLASNNIKN